MTAPVDPVEALAKVLYEASYRCRAEFMALVYHETVTVAWENEAPQDKNEWRAAARAALAPARELVPAEIPVKSPGYKGAWGWNACRAETLRRLGGDA